jgi:hypothetical protein
MQAALAGAGRPVQSMISDRKAGATMRWARGLVWKGCRPVLAVLGVLALATAGRAETVAFAPDPPEREVTVFNRSPRSINELYVSPSSTDQWGEDRLGDRTLAMGGSVRVRLGRSRECLFDAKVIYEDASREEHRGVNLCRTRQFGFDGSAATPAPETGVEHAVTLADNSMRPIQQVFISSAEAAQWGDDRLGNSSISVGDRREVSWRGDCVVDLRVVFENRAAEERRAIDLCGTPALSIEPGWTTMDVLPRPKAPVQKAPAQR